MKLQTVGLSASSSYQTVIGGRIQPEHDTAQRLGSVCMMIFTRTHISSARPLNERSSPARTGRDRPTTNPGTFHTDRDSRRLRQHMLSLKRRKESHPYDINSKLKRKEDCDMLLHLRRITTPPLEMIHVLTCPSLKVLKRRKESHPYDINSKLKRKENHASS